MPSALRSEARPYEATAWRAVERQSRFSTMNLVNTADEQQLLEQALDRAKPRYAPGTEHLHYLLTTPVRYKPDDRYGSRFSRPASRGLAKRPNATAWRADWTDRENVAACQALGMAAQEDGIDLIRYSSVRDPEEGAALALLTPCFRGSQPVSEATWHLSLLPDEISLQRDDHGDAVTLDYGWYMQDSRLAGLPAALGFVPPGPSS